MPDPATRLRLQADGDHRLQRPPDGRRIDVGVEAADDTDVLQAAQPPVASRRRDTDYIGKHAVGDTRVVVQRIEDAPVNVIDLDVRTFFETPRESTVDIDVRSGISEW